MRTKHSPVPPAGSRKVDFHHRRHCRSTALVLFGPYRINSYNEIWHAVVHRPLLCMRPRCPGRFVCGPRPRERRCFARKTGLPLGIVQQQQKSAANASPFIFSVKRLPKLSAAAFRSSAKCFCPRSFLPSFQRILVAPIVHRSFPCKALGQSLSQPPAPPSACPQRLGLLLLHPGQLADDGPDGIPAPSLCRVRFPCALQ